MGRMKIFIYGIMLMSALAIATTANATLVENSITVTTSGTYSTGSFDPPLLPSSPGPIVVNPQGTTDFTLFGTDGAGFTFLADFDVFDTGITLGTLSPGMFGINILFEGLDWGGRSRASSPSTARAARTC